jgi:hypothetical protein
MDLRGNLPRLFAAAAGLTAAGLVAACGGGSGPGDAIQQLSRVDYGKPYIGMSKPEVLRCAGQPRSRIPAGKTTETLVYHYSGAGPVPSSGDKKKEKATCTASLTFEKDKLVRVSYAHMEVRSPYDWQSEDNPEKAEEMRRSEVPSCVFSLPRCPRT